MKVRPLKGFALHFKSILFSFRLFPTFAGSCPVQSQTYLWQLSRSTRAKIREIAQGHHSWVNEDGANTAARLCHPDLILHVHRLNQEARTGSFFCLVRKLWMQSSVLCDLIFIRFWINLLHICWSKPVCRENTSVYFLQKRLWPILKQTCGKSFSWFGFWFKKVSYLQAEVWQLWYEKTLPTQRHGSVCLFHFRHLFQHSGSYRECQSLSLYCIYVYGFHTVQFLINVQNFLPLLHAKMYFHLMSSHKSNKWGKTLFIAFLLEC